MIKNLFSINFNWQKSEEEIKKAPMKEPTCSEKTNKFFSYVLVTIFATAIAVGAAFGSAIIITKIIIPNILYNFNITVTEEIAKGLLTLWGVIFTALLVLYGIIIKAILEKQNSKKEE